MLLRNFFRTVVVLFVVNSILNFILHALILPWETYPGIKRPEDMTNLGMSLIFVGNLIYSYLFYFIFTKGYENKGISEGVRYGLLIGFLFHLPYLFYNYANFQYSSFLLWGEFMGGVILNLIMGIIIAVLYKPHAGR